DVSTSSEDAGDSLADTAGDAAEGAEQFRSLFSGVTLARVGLVGVAAVIAAVGYAAYSASGDQDKFNESIAKSGNFAGTTAGQLEDMAVSIGGMKSNYGDVRDILNGLVSSGKFTGETLSSVAQAASMMAELSGQSADEVVSQFLKMADSATSWAANTNQQYHFLDLETYQRIQNLEDQGKKEEAIELASKAFKDATQERLQDIEQHLNLVARGWGNVKDAAIDAWQSIRSKASGALGLDAPDEARKKDIQDLEARIAAAGSESYVAMQSRDYQESVKQLKNRLALLKDEQASEEKSAEAKAKKQRIESEAIAASEKLKRVWDNNRSDIEKEQSAVEDLRKNYQALWQSDAGRETLQSRGVTSTDGKNFSGGSWDTDVKALDKSAQGAEQYNKQLQQTLNQKKAITELD
ncbi:phage tail length tape measure family protein, partial [Klebsiella michiganensis]|uniref:phage tail length tape measure family protein n=1 Tax=Klebsiella michiganensis TaxID=1134687 RepID=UPI0022CE1311